MRATFIGQYLHSIDPKNRLFIPPRFRDELMREGKNYFILTLGFEGCLQMFLPSEWESIPSKLSQTSLQNKGQARAFRRLFLAKATEVEVDGQGRILVPQLLKEEAALRREVFIVGGGNKVELWDKGRWAAWERRSRSAARKVAEVLEI